MSLPENFASPPHEELHRHFRNSCIEFKKTIQSTQDITQLQLGMEHFIEIAKQMTWQHPKTGVYHKDVAEKAVDKVWEEFKRYLIAIMQRSPNITAQDLLDALNEVERLINNFNVI